MNPSRSASGRSAALRVAFAGGGSGGHVTPALAIDDALRAEFGTDAYVPHFYGNRDRIEATLVTSMPIGFVPSAPLQRRLSFETLRTVAINLAGIVVALGALGRFRPDVVVATGGYVCFPVVVAARVLRALRIVRPAIAMVSIDATPGLTARLVAPLVDEVWTTFPSATELFGRKAVQTGPPVRASLRAVKDAPSARERLGLDPDRTTILVMGGSLGARSINEAVAALVTRRTLQPDWQVLHVSGERDYAYMQAEERALAPGNRVVLVPYLPDPADAYAAADVVVGRAGANTLAELAVTGTPAILVPYPHHKDQHQVRNAELFAAQGSAVVVADAALDGDTLWWALRDVLETDRLRTMRTAARSLAPRDATAAIVARIARAVPARVVEVDAANEAES